MIFQKKVDRAMKYSKEHAVNQHSEYDPKMESEETPLTDVMEKGDLTAMVLSGLIVIVPIALIALLFIGLVGLLPLLF